MEYWLLHWALLSDCCSVCTCSHQHLQPSSLLWMQVLPPSGCCLASKSCRWSVKAVLKLFSLYYRVVFCLGKHSKDILHIILRHIGANTTSFSRQVRQQRVFFQELAFSQTLPAISEDDFTHFSFSLSLTCRFPLWSSHIYSYTQESKSTPVSYLMHHSLHWRLFIPSPGVGAVFSALQSLLHFYSNTPANRHQAGLFKWTKVPPRPPACEWEKRKRKQGKKRSEMPLISFHWKDMKRFNWGWKDWSHFVFRCQDCSDLTWKTQNHTHTNTGQFDFNKTCSVRTHSAFWLWLIVSFFPLSSCSTSYSPLILSASKQHLFRQGRPVRGVLQETALSAVCVCRQTRHFGSHPALNTSFICLRRWEDE